MSLSCQGSNTPCVPRVNVVNVNSQLCPDPSANVVIMDTPRLYNAMMPWVGMYGQTQATKALGTVNVVPATARLGSTHHSTVQSQRVITTPAKTSAVVSNMGFSNAPSLGTYVQSLSDHTFHVPESVGTHAPVGHTGFTVAAAVTQPATGPSYGMTEMTNRTQSYGSILTSPIPLAATKNA